MRDRKKIPAKALKEGFEFSTLVGGGSSRMAHFKVLANNGASIIFDVYGREEVYSTEGLFAEVELSREELRVKYETDAKMVVEALRNEMRDTDNVGYHEMWNAWIAIDPWDFGRYCANENIKVVGWFKLSSAKIAMFSGDELDIGIVAEYEDGERFWCHAKSAWLKDIFEEWEEAHGRADAGSAV